MMSGRGVNPIFFHKKIKIRHTEHSLPLTPLPTSGNILFLPYFPTFSKWTPCLYHSYLTCLTYRISRPNVFCKKGVLRNFEKFTGKHPCQSLFFNKVTGQASTLSKKRLWCRCFSVNFASFLSKNTFSYRTPLLAASRLGSDCTSSSMRCSRETM